MKLLADENVDKSLAGNIEASAETGSLTKTFLVWFAVVSVVYWLNYLFITIISKSGIKGVAKIFTKYLKIYPPISGKPQSMAFPGYVGHHAPNGSRYSGSCRLSKIPWKKTTNLAAFQPTLHLS